VNDAELRAYNLARLREEAASARRLAAFYREEARWAASDALTFASITALHRAENLEAEIAEAS
jgi:hypothetical protein